MNNVEAAELLIKYLEDEISELDAKLVTLHECVQWAKTYRDHANREVSTEELWDHMGTSLEISTRLVAAMHEARKVIER